MGETRAFIAIELPKEVKDFLSEVTAGLRPGREKAVKWVAPEGIHLTLKFLGNIPEEQVVDITNALDKLAREIPSFELNLEGAGAFPNSISPRVIWVGIGGDIPELTNLQRQIERELAPLGFSPDKKAFSAHLTLGRVREKATRQERLELGGAVGELQINGTLPFRVTSISLIKSTLTSSGAIYNQLAKTTLDRK
ncbi:MAG: RNA 2',3'-cyclic phosphodiesterase [Dehalococcoidia bacterium]